jgi:RNA polymerase sigma factor (TIGR02999 family)
MSDVTRVLNAIGQGNAKAGAELLPLIYDELRRLAAEKLGHEKPGQTLQPTALVHEAYVRLVGDSDEPRWENRRHFFAAAAEAMRRILIENARRKQRVKHGGQQIRREMQEYDPVAAEPPEDLLALHDALAAFEREEPLKAELVKLRYFAGLSSEEAAAALGISRATAARYWTYARAWLYDRMGGATSG